MTDQSILLITGATGGVGQALAYTALEAGQCVILVAPNKERLNALSMEIGRTFPHAGDRVVTINADLSQTSVIQDLMHFVDSRFGRLDALINNASVVDLSTTSRLLPERFDQMQEINMHAPYFLVRALTPLLKRSQKHPHIVNVSPPLNPLPEHFHHHLSYSLSKYGLSMCTMGLSWELFFDGIAVNSVWPRVLLDTPFLQGFKNYVRFRRHLRKPVILAQAILSLLNKPSKACSGNFLIDDLLLEAEGVTDFTPYLNEAKTPFLIQSPFLMDDLDKGLYQTTPLERILLHTL